MNTMPVSGRGKTAKRASKPRYRSWNHELDVIGLKFRWKRDGRRALADMVTKRGSITGIRLVREPDNPADPNAIKVMLPERILDGKQLGYIRATSAELLAPKLDSGKLVVKSAKLETLHEADDWNEGVLVVVFGDLIERRK